MLAKKSKPKAGRRVVTLARPKTELTDVASPTVPGKTDYVERVVDLLTQMYNRHDISQIQFAAGDRYRTAYHTLSASAGGAGDFDRVRGAGSADGPAIAYVAAAGFVSDAKLKILYPRDYAVVHRVCVEGKTLEKVAQELSAFDLGFSFARREVAFMFKSALSQLAAAWWPDKAPRIDQSILEYVVGDDGQGRAQIVEYDTPEWQKLQHYRKLKGQQPLQPGVIRMGKQSVSGVLLRDEAPRMTSMIAERSVVTEAVGVERSDKIAHATRDRVFYSNQGKK